MTRKTVTVALDDKASAVAMLVQVASRYESSIYVECDSKRVNAKSIMGVMSLALNNGEEIVLSADGTDEDSAISGVEDYLVGNR